MNSATGLRPPTNGKTTLKASENSAAASADGSKLVATSYGGNLYTWQAVPRLSIGKSNSDLIVWWPSVSASSGYVLQTNLDFSAANWGDAGLPVNDDGTNKNISLPAPERNLFFQLKR